MSESSVKDFSNYVGLAAYVPKQLIILLPEFEDLGYVEDPSVWTDPAVNLKSCLKAMFEMHVLRTRIKATENRMRLMVEDRQEDYIQDFVFVERLGKVYYNAFRKWRAQVPADPFSMMMLEPDPTHTRVIDAWEFTDCRIDQIRTDAIPTRDLNTAVLHNTPVHTTVSVIGSLSHRLNLIEKGQVLLDKMNQSGMNLPLKPASTEVAGLRNVVNSDAPQDQRQSLQQN